jgi:hypothetical protein
MSVEKRPYYGTVVKRIPYAYRVVYDTARYGRNNVPTKRVIYGPYAAVITSFTVDYVNAADSLRPFTMVVMIDLGTISKRKIYLLFRIKLFVYILVL